MTRPLLPHYAGPWPSDLGRGSWGSRAPWTCQHCGHRLWREPRIRTISRPTRDYEGEYAWECPACGWAVVEESDMNADRTMHVTTRYTLRATRHLLAA